MNNNEFLHKMTQDIQNLLDNNFELLELWNKLTPLAQNEWICYVTIPKNIETKNKRLLRMEEDILNGKKRPCCWPGCPHRNPNNQKWFK